MEKEKISEKTEIGNNPKGGEMTLNELRKTVKRRISEITDLMVKDIDKDINVYDTILDLTSKIENLLYCEHGEYCQFPNALLWALDLADDIQRIAGYSKMIDVYVEASKIAYAIRKFYYR